MDHPSPNEVIDLFISSGEASGDLHGEKLIASLLKKRPHLKIGAMSGPKMRSHPIKEFFPMEKLQVMGFIDVLKALPRLLIQLIKLRNKILKLNPKAVVLIDYAEFHLLLAKILRKKGFQGKLIHYICPSVWAWRKNRILSMNATLDLLLTIFPFEKKCFENSPLQVEYVGNPLVEATQTFKQERFFQGKILSLFPGSRKSEVERNFPLQLRAARELLKKDPSLKIFVSKSEALGYVPEDVTAVDSKENYDLMTASHMALATSGTVTLELALHNVPTVVNFAIRKLDCFIAQKIFNIHLPYFCIVNIILNKPVFPELFGPNLTSSSLLLWAETLWFDENRRNECKKGCEEVTKSLGISKACERSAELTLSIMDF